MRTFPSLSAILAATLATGCHSWRGSNPVPPPLVLGRPSRAIPVEACTPSVDPGAPTGDTPPPLAEGELALLDVRGDDRLAFAGPFVATWSSDGEHLVTATEDSVLSWSVRTGKLESRIDLATSTLQPAHVAISPDGAWIAVSGHVDRQGGSSAATAWLLRANGATPARRLDGVGGALGFTADSRRLLAGARSVDLATGTLTSTPGLTNEALFLPDGRRAIVFVEAAAQPRQRLVPELRELATGAVIHRFPAVDSSSRVALSGDGLRLAIVEQALSVYSIDTFERVALVSEVDRTDMVHLSHDGRRAVLETLVCATFCVSEDHEVDEGCAPVLAVWDLDRGALLLHTPTGAGSGWLFSRDGAYLTGTDTRLIEEIIRVEDGAALRFGSRIRTISPDSRRVLFDGKLGLEIASLDGSIAPLTLARAPRVLARSADGRLVAELDNGGRLRIKGPGSCARLGLMTGPWIDPKSPYDHLDPDHDQIAFSPDGASLFTMTRTQARQDLFRAFRTSDGAERWSVARGGSQGVGAYVLANARQVIFQGDGRFELGRFDAIAGAALPAGRAPAIAYKASSGSAELFDVRDPGGDRPRFLVSPVATRDGRSLATFGTLDNASRFSIWDPLDPRRVIDVPVGGWPHVLALSPDERLWAAGLTEGGVRIFARDGSHPVDVASGHTRRITALAFTRSGDRLATAAEDGAVLFVDTSSGAVVGRARLPLDRATHLWIAPDERELWADTARGQRVRFGIVRR